jgi:GNAT superfamily N-acetyltransferase
MNLLPEIHVLEVPYASAHYAATVALRQHVLRSPLGLHYTPDQLAQDAGTRQFAAMRGDALVGCVMLHALDATHARLRQFAVTPEMQGQGVGSLLLNFFETTARDAGFCQVQLSARETARKFYEKNGYTATGAAYIEIGLPHIGMEKTL